MPAVYSPCGVILLLTNRVSSAALLAPAKKTAHAMREAAIKRSARKPRSLAAIASSPVATNCDRCNDGLQCISTDTLVLREEKCVRYVSPSSQWACWAASVGGADAQQTSPIPLTPMTVQGAFAVSEGTLRPTSAEWPACRRARRESACWSTTRTRTRSSPRSRTIAWSSETLCAVDRQCAELTDARTLHRTRPARKPMISRIWTVKGSLMPRPIFTSSVLTDADAPRESFGCLPLSSRGCGSTGRDNRSIASAGLWPAKTFAQAVETTYRVSDLLKRAGKAAAFFGKDLESADGLNIEGVAVQGDTIWFGLRAPVRKNKTAYLVSGDIADLFKAGNKPSKARPEVVPIELDGLGIRDLAPLPDKRLLVVAGAAHGPEVPFKLFVVDPAKGKVTPIGPLAAVTAASRRRDENRQGRGRDGSRYDGRQGADRGLVRQPSERGAASGQYFDPRAQ